MHNAARNVQTVPMLPILWRLICNLFSLALFKVFLSLSQTLPMKFPEISITKVITVYASINKMKNYWAVGPWLIAYILVHPKDFIHSSRGHLQQNCIQMDSKLNVSQCRGISNASSTVRFIQLTIHLNAILMKMASGAVAEMFRMNHNVNNRPRPNSLVNFHLNNS